MAWPDEAPGQADDTARAVRFEVLHRDGFTCRYCGRGSPQVVLHIDHVHPRSRGGADTPGNYVTACEDCNGGKGARAGITPPPSRAQPEPLPPARKDAGPVGLFGHAFNERGELKHQFHVAQAVGADSYLVELFSWLDGGMCETQVWSRSQLLPPTRMFATPEAWNAAAEEQR